VRVEAGMSRSTPPPWNAADSLHRPKLGRDLTTDVCVVGAGIAGLTIAYLLRREGLSVVVLEAGAIGRGQTGRTTAHLSSALDDGFVALERVHGPAGARAAAESHVVAIDRIEATVREEEIDCRFARVDGYLFSATGVPGGEASPALLAERAAARRAGLQVEVVERAPVSPLDTGPCLRFPRQARIEPLRYLGGLARALEKRGGMIFTGTRATSFDGAPGRVVTGDGSVVSAAAIVVATNSPVNDVLALHTKQAPYTSYALALRTPHGAIADILLWDDADPYHYVRLEPGTGEDGDLLVVGGEDHKTGHGSDGVDRHARLEAWARERFAALGAVEQRWSGQVMETSDGLAFIGRNPGTDDDVFVVSGDSGHGMTHGTIAGMLVCDLVQHRTSPWQGTYDPARIRLAAAGAVVREGLAVARDYLAWITPGERAAADDIRSGEGAVLREGLAKVAAYRDDEGVLHRRSAICPHLGCVVTWNGVERTWDCPCHGSRFDCRGRVVNGPANRDLACVDR